MAQINFHNVDCLSFMANVPDKFYRLAIVDPPFGIGETWKKNRKGIKKFNGNYKNESAPGEKYFDELFRVSEKYIVFGANYFQWVWPAANGFIWDKNGNIFTDYKAEFEIAVTNITKYPWRKFKYEWNGARKGSETGIEIIHPHQKPILLYRDILKNYAKPGDNILDTHGGSMSIAIACDMEGYDIDICEIDKEYFDAGVKRFQEYKRQLKLF